MKASLVLVFAAVVVATASPTPKPSLMYPDDGRYLIIDGRNRWGGNRWASLVPNPNYRWVQQWNGNLGQPWNGNSDQQWTTTYSVPLSAPQASASAAAVSQATSSNFVSPTVVRQWSPDMNAPVQTISTTPWEVPVQTISTPLVSQVASTAAASASAYSNGNGPASNYGWTTNNPAYEQGVFLRG